MKLVFQDNNPKDGFFNEIKNSHSVRIKQDFSKNGKVFGNKSIALTGNMLPNISRSKRAHWDSEKNMWNINLTESELLDLANKVGFRYKGQDITRVSKHDKLDPFITSIKIDLNNDYVLDDETPLGKLHKAVLEGRRDILMDGNKDLLSHKDKKNLQYKSIVLGERTDEFLEESDTLDERIAFYTALQAKTLAVKTMMLDRLGFNIDGIPEEKIVNAALVKRWEQEGNVKIGKRNDEMTTNRALIDRMMAQDTGDLEIEYYIYRAHRLNYIMWLTDFKYYEYDGINLGRKLSEVVQFLTDDKNADILHKIIGEIKSVEDALKKGIKKTKKN